MSTARSIGEILDDLRGDFPDISVSKIRFLESQGLITPERSPSGYRQFTDADLELLRWILRQQRDHYLPLKVIRRRLKEGDGPHREVDVSNAGAGVEAGAGPGGGGIHGGRGGSPQASRTVAARRGRRVARVRRALIRPPLAPAAPGRRALADRRRDASYTAADLRKQTGLDEAAIGELESFGLLPPAGPDGYGPEALRVAEIAAAFFAYGVEARHLRMYKRAAEQEATFLSQVAQPMMNAKDSGAAARATEALTDLARLGAGLRLSMLRVGLGPPPGA